MPTIQQWILEYLQKPGSTDTVPNNAVPNDADPNDATLEADDQAYVYCLSISRLSPNSYNYSLHDKEKRAKELATEFKEARARLPRPRRATF